MKRSILFVYVLVITSFLSVYSQSENSIIGVWLTQEGKSKIEIYKNGDSKFDGKIVWLRNGFNEDGSPKTDIQNPDEKLKARKVLGLKLLHGFEFEDNEWIDGKIYDPMSGKTYSCLMWFEDGDTDKLHVKGFIGFSLLGREVVWSRTN